MDRIKRMLESKMEGFKSIYMETYENLFSDDEGSLKAKAEAFDKIAACYYDCNFGTTTKAEIDLLMFSIFLDQAMEKSNQNYAQFDDYALSKQFGITQTRLSSLRERKALKYPSGLDWMERLEKLSQNARFRDGFILLHIPEKDIINEIEHAVVSQGGFLYQTLNRQLMKIEPNDFLCLMMMIAPEKESREIKEKVRYYLMSTQQVTLQKLSS